MRFRIMPSAGYVRGTLMVGMLALTCASSTIAQVSAGPRPVDPDQVFSCPKPIAVAPRVTAASDVPPPPGPQAVAKPQDFEAERGRGFPRWSAFPPPPENVPTAADIRRRVMAVNATRDSYLTGLKGLQWDEVDATAYQAATVARLDALKMAPIEVLSCEQILEFARQKQKLATPPPIADN